MQKQSRAIQYTYAGYKDLSSSSLRLCLNFFKITNEGTKTLYYSCADVEVIKVPQYKGLKVSDIFKFAELN